MAVQSNVFTGPFSLTSEGVTGALGYTPLNRAGDTMLGDLKFTDATYDIGKSGATRPRDLFLSRNLAVGGTGIFSGNTTISGSSASGGHFFFADTAGAGQTWQVGPGAASADPDVLSIYNQGTSTLVASFGKTGTFKTAAPAGASALPWKFGSMVAGAVTPDATQSLFVDVNGVVVKLIVAA